MPPLVSIGMPVYNCAETVKTAIFSIMWQTYPNWELLIIDDGSTDQTLEIIQKIKDPRIKIITDGKNLRLPSRLNQAINLSKGELFARMDADDIAFPTRLCKQVRFLEENSEIDLVGSKVLIFQNDGDIVGTYPFKSTHDDICRRPWSGFYLPHPTWMGRRSWFLKYPYKETMTKAQDQDLLLRSYHLSKFACIPQYLHGYRVENISLKKILHGRLLFISALFHVGQKRRFWRFYYGILEQITKLLVDVLSIISGLKYAVLTHRALPVDEVVSKQWKQIWIKLSKK